MDSLLFQIATKDGGFQENMSCYHKIQNCTMRFDAVYHLLKIRKATKKHLIRVVYFDDQSKELVSTNALRLQFSSTGHGGI